MLAPDYQEFANWPGRAIRDNTVISAALRQLPVEINQALRDCHAKPGENGTFGWTGPKGRFRDHFWQASNY